MTPIRVLLIDDEATFRRAMAKALLRKGLSVRELAGGGEAIAALSSEEPDADVAVLDLQMPGVSGIEVLRKTPRRKVKIVVLTGHGTIPDAVEAMRLGAFSFLLKPIDADELLPVLKQAAQQQVGAPDLLGQSEATKALRELLDNLAPAEDPVLLCGETGTGKEVVARYLHQRSGRAGHPFVAVNLACLPADLFESELFGHTRGAFTGADRRKVGLFAEAGEGTLFLDEVSELPLLQQPKLLRVLESRMFTAVGEGRETALRARLIAATNRDLKQMVSRGEFREDLYYRLAVFPVQLSPLRERTLDIVPIAEFWLRKLASGGTLSEEAERALLAHDYPGNVRELVNVIRRVVLFTKPPQTTIPGDLVRRMLAEDPFRTLRPSPSSTEASAALVRIPPSAPAESLLVSPAAQAQEEPLSLRELEIRHIERLLREYKNITMVAKILDIDRRTLQRKLRALGIDWRDGSD